MSYSTKLNAIAEKKKKLLDEESKLVEQRKQEIGEMAERLGLLTASDTLLAGILMEAQQAIHDKQSERLKNWEHTGGRFLNKPKRNTKTPETSMQ